MGAGKSHILRWLSSQGYFPPLEAFVRVDPDLLRNELPETKAYFAHNPEWAGILTQKEVGYISEVLTLYALQQGKNAIVDGSLRDAQWYTAYLKGLRDRFPGLRIAIMEVAASEETILARARSRGDVTGRVVPEWLLLQYMREVPEAVKQLTPAADYVCCLWNDGNRARTQGGDDAVDGADGGAGADSGAGLDATVGSDEQTAAAANGRPAPLLRFDSAAEYVDRTAPHPPRRSTVTVAPILTYTSSGSLSWKDFKSVWSMWCPVGTREHDHEPGTLPVTQLVEVESGAVRPAKAAAAAAAIDIASMTTTSYSIKSSTTATTTLECSPSSGSASDSAPTTTASSPPAPSSQIGDSCSVT